MPRTPTYKIFVSRRGNVFMTELADLIERSLRDLGRPVERCTLGLPEREADTVNLVVAPHEFFHFAALDGVSTDRIAAAAAASACITTEQMGTPWFDMQVGLCAPSPLVLDISRSAVDALSYLGLTATHLPLGYHSSIDRWGGADKERPVDVSVLAALNPRREKFLAHAAGLLWDRACEVHMFTFDLPMSGGEPGFLIGEEKFDHLARAKLLLNVHRSDVGYFEWLRVIEAMANGCVVVSEDSVGYAPLVPFEHFVQAPLDALAEYAVLVLVDDEWRRELARNAYEFIRTELDFNKNMAALLPRIDDAVATGRPRQRNRGIPRTPSPPARAHPGAPFGAQIGSVLGYLDERSRLFGDAAKTLFLSQRSGIRQLEEVKSALRYGTNIKVDTSTTPAFDLVTPDVSVVLTNYNYGHVVRDAMESVIANVGLVPELIVVDDHSNDDSLQVITEIMEAKPWFPIMLVAKQANQGLSAARNDGFERARSEFVFVLDADNSVYPTGLKLLHDALSAQSDGAFAYGLIDCFSDTVANVSLISCLPWDPARLTQANYIDAMALVRKSAWKVAGGYDLAMDALFGGWEDYDLWLRLSDQGYRGVFVPTPIARYRVHGSSMLRSFNWAPENAINELRSRYPDLPWARV